MINDQIKLFKDKKIKLNQKNMINYQIGHLIKM